MCQNISPINPTSQKVISSSSMVGLNSNLILKNFLMGHRRAKIVVKAAGTKYIGKKTFLFTKTWTPQKFGKPIFRFKIRQNLWVPSAKKDLMIMISWFVFLELNGPAVLAFAGCLWEALAQCVPMTSRLKLVGEKILCISASRGPHDASLEKSRSQIYREEDPGASRDISWGCSLKITLP